jgi:hypothetical protein
MKFFLYTIALISLLCTNTFGQTNKRYMMLVLTNISQDESELTRIQNAYNSGFNAVLVTVRLDAVKYPNYFGYNRASEPWKQYDDQIAKARSLGMKVAIGVWLDEQCYLSDTSDPSNNYEDAGNASAEEGWGKAERIQGWAYSQILGQAITNENIQKVYGSLTISGVRWLAPIPVDVNA